MIPSKNSRSHEQLLVEINRELMRTSPYEDKKLASLRTLKKQLQARIEAAHINPEEAVFYVSVPQSIRNLEMAARQAVIEIERIDQILPTLSLKEFAKTAELQEARRKMEQVIKASKLWPTSARVTSPGSSSARWVRCAWDERENVQWFLDSIGASWQEVEE